MGAPYDYSTININNSIQSPNTVHCRSTAIVNYFVRYLFNRLTSIFKFDNLPSTWDKNYFINNLYSWGYLTVFNTDKFGVIPQVSSLSGFNVFYRPTTSIVSNPLLRGVSEMRISKDCELIMLTPDYRGLLDIVTTYADMMGLCMEAVAISLVNSKNAYIFSAADKAAAESLKKLFDKINSGEPAVVMDKALIDPDQGASWTMFNNSVGQNYITSNLLSDLRSIENMFCTEIGLPNANYNKKERLITDEVMANRAETYSNATIWYRQLTDSIAKVNDMFGLDIAVDWTYKLKEVQNNGDNINIGNV